MFKKCIIFDEIKRQQYITPDTSIHTDAEIKLLQDQIDYINMLKDMREIK